MSAVTEPERVEAQTAFVGLLTRPLLSPANDPDLHRLVVRHQRRLAEWASRCGYRLVMVGQVVRLHRTPLDREVAAPPIAPAPPRRELVLTLCSAAACEESDGTTTVQWISDQVRALTGVPDSALVPYDPDRRIERVLLLRALGRLEWLGVLRRRTRDEEMLRVWEESRVGVGAGYEVDRAALLQVTDPHAVALALDTDDRPFGTADEDGGPDANRPRRLVRWLLETPALLYADLPPSDAEYARNRRSQLAAAVAEMTGGTVETRAEGMVLVLPPERATSAAATVDWPRAATVSWVALLLADAAMRGDRDAVGADGVRSVPSEVIAGLADELHAQRYAALTKDLRGDPLALRDVAERVLVDAGVLRLDDDGSWRLLPAAARYRDPAVVATAGRLFDEAAS
jgi:uncharacterized protein (TIGR02678 family)